MASPVEFISYSDATQTFRVNGDALAILRGIEGPVGVISISGRARQGKSFILNQLLGQNGAFKVASTHRPCTKGIWIWSKPIPRSVRDEKFHLILLDTEGVDAFDQTGRYSTQVFCLAVLLSSLFVFNQMGPIDESALNQLSLVSQMTKNVRVKADQGPSRSEELQAFTPSFLWLLRDFYLELMDGGSEVITPREYLEIALRHVHGSSPEVASKNEMRESIKSLFPDRDCCMLVRPVADEASLVQLDTLPQSALRQEFREGVQNLLRMLNDKTRPKRLGNSVVTGSMLAGLAEAYVRSINEGAVPTIATAWMNVAESETRRAIDNAEHKYEAEFDTSVQPEEDILYAEHQRCVALAQMTFDEGAVGDEHLRKPHRERLLHNLKKRFDLFKGMKGAEAASRIDSMLMQAATELVQNGDRASVRELHQQLLTFVEGYEKEAVGSAKWERLCSFVMNNVMTIIVQKATQLETTLESAKDAHQKVLDELQKKTENEIKAMELQNKYSELQGCHTALMQQSAQDKTELQSLKVEFERCVQERQQSEALLSNAQSQLHSVTEEKTRLTSRLEQMSMNLKTQEEALSLARQEASDARNAESTCRRESQEHMSRVQSTLNEMQRDKDQIMDGWRQERLSTERRISQGQVQLDTLQSQLEESQRTNTELKEQIRQLQSVGSSQSNGVHQRYSWDESMGLRMQLNETTDALKAAQERIKVLERGVGAQSPRWTNPMPDSSSGHFPDVSGTPAGTPVARPRPKLPIADLDKMTIAQLKDWLMKNDHEDVVWEAQKGANPRKADWIRMVKERL